MREVILASHCRSWEDDGSVSLGLHIVTESWLPKGPDTRHHYGQMKTVETFPT